MENTKVSINLFSHNINGFAGSEQFMNTKCDENNNTILCVQEHWLRPAFKKMRSINQLRLVHPLYDGYGVSAMKDSHNTSVNSGRPYGGTGFVFSKDFTPFLRPIQQYEGERISVMKLMDADFTILILNVYFPFKQSGEEHRVKYIEVLGSLKSIIDANPSAKFIITGDFNYDIYDESQPMSRVICDFLQEYDLVSTHDLDSNYSYGLSYTRSCAKRNSFSLLDYIFISRSLRDRVKNCHIDYDGRNPSDHVPVRMQIEVVPLITGDGSRCGDSLNNRVNWSLLKNEDISNYELTMEHLLDSIQVPGEVFHGFHYCMNEHHVFEIEKYFQSIISVIEISHSVLPKKSAHGKKGKGFWSDTLTKLKKESVDAFDTWSRSGRPYAGPTFESKKRCHYAYKAELRRQRRLFGAEKSEALGVKLVEKNYSSFWRNWKNISQVNSPPVNRIGDAITEPDIASAFQTFLGHIRQRWNGGAPGSP